jgi:polyisoprenoid-binding protein YceI
MNILYQKKYFYLFIFLFSLSFSCKNEVKPKEEIDITAAAPVEKTAGIATVYEVKSKSSKILWTAANLASKHSGVFEISSGRFTVIDGNITTGDFDIDLRNLSVTDLKGDEKTELETHLRGADFFEVEKFSIARFVIQKVEKIEPQNGATYSITGDLTLKDITKPVVFLANIDIQTDKITASSTNFSINRTQWNLAYQSTLLGIPLNKAIKDEIGLKIELSAERK